MLSLQTGKWYGIEVQNNNTLWIGRVYIAYWKMSDAFDKFVKFTRGRV